ncbi:hypothetical protein Nmel_016956 [Mimus melanotis]
MEDEQQTLIQGYDSPELWQDVPKPSSLPETILLYNQIDLIPDEGSKCVCEVTRSNEGMGDRSNCSEGTPRKYPWEWHQMGVTKQRPMGQSSAQSIIHSKPHLTKGCHLCSPAAAPFIILPFYYGPPPCTRSPAKGVVQF